MFTLQVNEKIFLRMLSARDSAQLFELTDQSRDYLKQWLPWLDSIRTANDSLEFIKGTFTAYNNRTGITAGIFYDDELAGIAGYNYLDFRNKIGQIGYWLEQDKQGKGIMTQSIGALTNYGFEQLRLNRIEIRQLKKIHQAGKLRKDLAFKRKAVFVKQNGCMTIMLTMLFMECWNMNGWMLNNFPQIYTHTHMFPPYIVINYSS